MSERSADPTKNVHFHRFDRVLMGFTAVGVVAISLILSGYDHSMMVTTSGVLILVVFLLVVPKMILARAVRELHMSSVLITSVAFLVLSRSSGADVNWVFLGSAAVGLSFFLLAMERRHLAMIVTGSSIMWATPLLSMMSVNGAIAFLGAFLVCWGSLFLIRDRRVALLNERGVHYRMEDDRAAERDYRTALRYSPRCGIVWNNLGNLLMDQRRYEEAIRSYNRAIRYEPRFSPSRTNRFEALRQSGRKFRCNAEKRAMEARFYGRIGAYAWGLRVFSSLVMGLSVAGIVSTVLVSAYPHLDKHLMVLMVVGPAVVVYLYLVRTLAAYGTFLKDRDDLAGAHRYLTLSLRLLPLNPWALNNRGNLYTKMGLLNLALRDLGRACMVMPTSTVRHNRMVVMMAISGASMP